MVISREQCSAEKCTIELLIRTSYATCSKSAGVQISIETRMPAKRVISSNDSIQPVSF